MALDLNTKISSLYGIGPAKAKAYAHLGIETTGDLILHYPRRYENRGDVRLLCDTEPSTKSSVILTIATEPKATTVKGRLSLLKFRAFDDSGVCEITYFNQNFLKNVFSVGLQFRFFGKTERKGKSFTMSSPTYEPYSEERVLPTLVPIYPLTDGLSQKQLTKDLSTIFSVFNVSNIKDPLPEKIRAANSLCTLPYAIKNIHSPENFVALATAKRRLVFDEFFTFALGISLARVQNRSIPAEPCKNVDVSPLISLLPYELTNAQKRVIENIKNDLSSSNAMRRIIVGDVGCGKTVCAAAAIYMAVKSGRQAALMVPTEILAIQHHKDMKELFDTLNIRCELLTSSGKKSKKQEIYAALSSSVPSERIDVVIGTQALLTDEVNFNNLGLVITDEQHRFGVNQRASLSEKSNNAHMLVMSATPIPRSMALALYGDLDLSLIDEMPPGRQKVDTFVVNESYRERLNAFISKQVHEGGQVYIVCPAVEESEDSDNGDISIDDIDSEGNVTRKTALKTAVEFSAQISDTFKGLRVEYLHGKMKSADKEATMKKFAAGEIDILVSTTVIEVGVNVPNACLMIVENAERFGLSQLHQLRGRVGRGSRKSYCILVSQATEGRADERLKTMSSIYDGYSIAEKDLIIRGPGDFLRTGDSDDIRQSGGVRFKLAQFCDDTEALTSAFKAAKDLLDISPDLEEYPDLLSQVYKMFSPDHTALN